MSDLLNQASLVMIPSGYKEDIVYSQIPTNGNGDLTFTRASNGTRINSAGLVEVCPWNLVRYSEEFDNTAWVKANSTVTANQTTAPNGTTTADKIEISSATNATVQQGVSSDLLISGLPCTFTVYLKSVSGTGKVGIRSGQTGLSSLFNFTNEWQRFTWTFNSAASLEIPQFCNNTLVGGADAAPTFYVWGAQLNIGSTAKPYFPTTDRLNVPRLTYQNGGGGCPSLLLEKQSTNLALYSNALSTSPNIVESSSSTATANVYVSPDGTQNAMRFTETTANDKHGFYQYTTVTAQTYTASIFTKQTGRRYICLVSDITGTSATSFFDLQTISVVSSGSGHTCSIQDFGNGWMRLIVTFTATAGSRYLIWGGSPNGTTDTYAGSTSISQTFYGYQIEASSYATSYIPTTSSSATRVADACYKTGISSLIGQTSGTIFLDGYFEPNDTGWGEVIRLQGATSGDSIVIYFNPSGQFYFEMAVGGVAQASGYLSYTGGRLKIAIAYANNDVKLYINGTEDFADTSASIPTCSSLYLLYGPSAQNKQGQVNQFLLFKTRLTNAELQAITTI